MREKSINFQKLEALLLPNERKKKKRKKKRIRTHTHASTHTYIHVYMGKYVPTTYFLSSPGKESLIKVRGWDKCAVRCILKHKTPTRAALNANSFRRYFAFPQSTLLFRPFSGPLVHPVALFRSLQWPKVSRGIVHHCWKKNLYCSTGRSNREKRERERYDKTITFTKWCSGSRNRRDVSISLLN